MSPEEVWNEANRLAALLRSNSEVDVSMRVREAFDDLCDLFSSFVLEDESKTRRTSKQAEHSAMMVSFVALLLLVNVHEEVDTHPYRCVCQAIHEIASAIPGYKDLYEETRAAEDDREAQGQFIEVADFIEEIATQEGEASPSEKAKLQEVVGIYVDEASKCGIRTMIESADLLSRTNDRCGHCIQPQVDLLRNRIDEKLSGGSPTIPDPEAIVKKREALKQFNTILDFQPNGKNIDAYYLYIFIEEHFVSRIQFVHEWVALRFFLEKHHILKQCTVKDFAELMNREEWFSNASKPCKANEINTYNFLSGSNADKWLGESIPFGSKATKKSINRIYRAYQELEINKGEIGL